MKARTGIALAAACATVAGVTSAEAAALINGNRIKNRTIKVTKLTSSARATLRGNRGVPGYSLVYTAATGGFSLPTFLGLNNTIDSTELNVQGPAAPGTSRAVALRGLGDVSATDITYTLRVNGVDTSLTCSATTGSSCTKTSSVAIASTDVLSIGLTSTDGKFAGASAVLTFAQ